MPPKVGKGVKGGKDAKGGKKKKDVDPSAPEVIYAKAATKINQEKQNLAVELAFNKDKLVNEQIYVHQLEGEMFSLKDRLAKTTNDSDDILTHKQREIKLKMERVLRLESQVREITSELGDANAEVQKLFDEQVQNREKLEDAIQLLVDKNMLEDVVRQQDAVIAKQEEDIVRQVELLEERDATIEEHLVTIEELELKSSTVCKLRIAFGDPWLLTRTRHRLRGEAPFDRDDNTLTCLGGKHVALYGGNVKQDAALSLLNLETNTWSTELQEAVVGTSEVMKVRSGHSANTMSKNKLLVIGGSQTMGRDKFPNQFAILQADTNRWTLMDAKGTGPARQHHAACAVREKMFVFGGQSHALLNDLLVLDVELMKWATVTPNGVSVPTPRRSHSLSSTEDGRKMWMFGGFDGQQVLNDLWAYDVERRTWVMPIVTGMPPPPREMHVSTFVNKYLIVAGGIDGARRYNDIFVLNTERMEWEVIDNGEGVEILSWKPRGVYSAFQGSRLLSVKPNRDEALDELEITDIQLPESLEELWQQRAAKSEDLEKLEIRDDAQTFPNAIEVSWKAPPKLVDRVDRFKLMMANNTGVVKEVCQGKYDRFRVTGLRANTEYVFCVKAIYDDGTHVWSESKGFKTRFSTTLPAR
mmetsp:Transcript_48583/g.92931  ORF Transcript_48583/g.92931 Transcript_48583/m.92931 type:complete len:641 (+) Transcript_48583:158-2080(+)